MPKIKVNGDNKEILYGDGENLLEILLREGFFVDNPCNGKGVCGKCRIKVTEGHIEEPAETEKELLSRRELESGIRLSCLVNPTEDISVELLQKEREHKVLTAGYIPEFEFNPNIKKILVNIKKPGLKNQIPFEEQFKIATGVKNVNINSLFRSEYIEGKYTATVCNDEIIEIEQGDTTDSIFGLAVDIGTTTVVCELVDMSTGKQMAHSSMINAQKHFGLDVLTRITYEIENPENGIEKLQSAIVDSMNEMIEDVCRQTGTEKKYIYEICVGANCTMMHMLLGINAKTIGKSPYAPIFTGSKDIPARDIGINISERGRIYCLPSVSSYIGADIVAGAYVCGLKDKKGNVLFIDIGTNGEIVLSKAGKLVSCSCAAGPALEGMNISSGMRASEGAIEDIEIEKDGSINLKIIGDKEPVGICGSGILAAVRELVRSGIIKKDGAFIKKDTLDGQDFRNSLIQMNGRKREFVVWEKKITGNKDDITEKILITQGDVRQVQLAKGAILSGFIALLNKAGITMEELDKVMIAG